MNPIRGPPLILPSAFAPGTRHHRECFFRFDGRHAREAFRSIGDVLQGGRGNGPGVRTLIRPRQRDRRPACRRSWSGAATLGMRVDRLMDVIVSEPSRQPSWFEDGCDPSLAGAPRSPHLGPLARLGERVSRVGSHLEHRSTRVVQPMAFRAVGNGRRAQRRRQWQRPLLSMHRSWPVRCS